MPILYICLGKHSIFFFSKKIKAYRISDMINKIVFDLDGTLWTTEDAYVESYKRIAREFSFTPESDDVVRECLGVKLDQVVLKLFSRCPDK